MHRSLTRHSRTACGFLGINHHRKQTSMDLVTQKLLIQYNQICCNDHNNCLDRSDSSDDVISSSVRRNFAPDR